MRGPSRGSSLVGFPKARRSRARPPHHRRPSGIETIARPESAGDVSRACQNASVTQHRSSRRGGLVRSACGDPRNASTRIEDPNRRFRAASRRPTRFPPLQRDDRIAAVPSPADGSSPLSGAFRALASLLAHRPGPVPADGRKTTLGI